ncbi:hypothetical protein EJB05_27966 [Eragrostis curvula]|uniref:Chalcone synthase n=1 Tax=Eragrostis curvula TaxID=38414 RepID=A0A5J9UNP5_9POAL|nr:hypothetical protein EJB05_27966 [Eragrostis curvula]
MIALTCIAFSSFWPSSRAMETIGHTALQVEKLRREQRANGPACILAVGTANPENCITQDNYTDWYFEVTKSDHLTHLKDIMKKTCEKMGVKKRYIHVTEELLRDHPELLDPATPSIDTRLQLVAAALPDLAAAAAVKAISEWGRPAGDITHLVFSTSSGAHMPGADGRVASILGLRPTVQRTAVAFQACTGGAAALRVAKDIAENNRGARVLVVCADALSVMGFHALGEEARPDGFLAHAIFGDGAGAVVVGADPVAPGERPVFEMVLTAQVTLPGTEKFISCDYGAGGLVYNLAPPDVPVFVGDNIEPCLTEALKPLGIVSGGWNSLFWVVHPGSPVILDSYEKALRLEPRKLAASHRVLSEYGNMVGPSVIFVLDEVVRGRRQEEEGEGVGRPEWGVLVGLGPGFTVEMTVLQECSNK